MKSTVKNGLIIGLILGIFAAFFYAPRSGKELRNELKEKLDAVPNQLLNLFESLVDLMIAIFDFAKESFEEQSCRISEAVSSGLYAAKEKSEELRKVATNNGN